MRALALALAAALTTGACADLSAGQAGAPLSASPSATPTSTADCVTLGAITPVPVPPLEVVDLTDGIQRVTSAEGGYSLLVPSAWLVSGSLFGNGVNAFGQAHMSSYDPRTAPQPRLEAGGILPPEVGIRLDVEVWANTLGEAPDAFARHVRIGPDQVAVMPGSFMSLSGVQAYRTTIQDERRFQPADAPLIATRQTRALWVIPSPRADRVLVIYATPAESPLLPVVERAVSTLAVTAPAQAVQHVIHQRSEILQRWLVGKSGPVSGRRAEAKLMTYAEAAIAVHPGQPAQPGQPQVTPMGILRIDRDPEELFWIVAVSGPDLPQGRLGPAAPGTPPPTTWMLYTTAATADPNRAAGTGSTYSSIGTWPPGFDALPDRCH